MNTSELVEAAGLGPWESYPVWSDLLGLAVAIEGTIMDPINRAAFAAQAARDLRDTPPDNIEGGDFTSLTEEALAARPTPHGSTELWGSALRGV
jgi:hypothetical protein